MLIFILKKHSAELQRIQTERSVILVIARLLISGRSDSAPYREFQIMV